MTKFLQRSALTFFVSLAVTIGSQAQLIPNLGGQRTGISALTSLKADLSPRSIAIGGANVASLADGYAANNNPALASELTSANFTLSTLKYANIFHHYASAIIPTKNQGAFILSVNNLSSGEMAVRTELQPEGTGQTFYYNTLSAGVGYSKSLSDMFSFGGFVKYVRESIAEYNVSTAVVDLGFLYRTDYKDLRFAAAIQHFGVNSTINGNTKLIDITRVTDPNVTDFPPPTLFKLGASITALKLDQHKITALLQLNHPNDNAENIRIGAEYNYTDLLFIRAGYKINVVGENLPTAGVGIKTKVGIHRLHVDYAVMPTQYLGTYHCIGLSFSLNNDADKATPNLNLPQ